MKIALVSNFDLETGRGPVFRLMNTLPFLTELIDIVVISLQEPDSSSKEIFDSLNLKYYVIRYKTDGWSVIDCEQVVEKVIKIITQESADLCILGWEYWDICVELNKALAHESCKFATIFHSIPFVDAIPFPYKYENDIRERIHNETNDMIKRYLQEKSAEAETTIKELNIISINETVSYYLEHYFSSLNFYKAYPGYALNIHEIERVQVKHTEYDFVYMSKLERSKGIFDLLSIIENISKTNQDIRFLIIGDFLYEEEKIEFLTQMKNKGLMDKITLAGWLFGIEKYQAIKSARVFIYPSLTGDTFSFCLLEALACGLEAVCYDAPFSRIIYDEAPVKRVAYNDCGAFATEALKLLDDSINGKSNNAVEFVRKYYSDWRKVALAEASAYEKVYRS